MAQEIKVFAGEHDDFEFDLQNLPGRVERTSSQRLYSDYTHIHIK